MLNLLHNLLFERSNIPFSEMYVMFIATLLQIESKNVPRPIRNPLDGYRRHMRSLAHHRQHANSHLLIPCF